MFINDLVPLLLENIRMQQICSKFIKFKLEKQVDMVGRSGPTWWVRRAPTWVTQCPPSLATCKEEKTHFGALSTINPMSGCDEPMAPQDSAIISKKNSNVSNISTSIDLSKTNTRDLSGIRITDGRKC